MRKLRFREVTLLLRGRLATLKHQLFSLYHDVSPKRNEIVSEWGVFWFRLFRADLNLH